MAQYGTADIHIHTIFSDGMMSPEALVEFVLYETTVDARTDYLPDSSTTYSQRTPELTSSINNTALGV